MVQPRGRRRPAFRRTIIVGTVSALAVLGGLAPASGAPGSAAEPAAAPFSNGMAKATAAVTKVAPGVGSLELALGSGVAVAELRNQLAQAQAQSFDMGLIGTTLTAEACDGSDGAITPDQLPQPTRVDNRQGDTEASSDEAPIGDSSLGGGREVARASTTPSATAVVTTAASETPVITIDGGQASATTEVVDGAARQARASSRVNLTLAGVVELSGMRWDALHRTGADPQATASFSIGAGTLGGVPLPLDDLAAAEDVINEALAPTGLSVAFPRVERFEAPTDLVRVTPLQITMRDSELGSTIFGPGLNASRAQREQLFDELSAAYCQMAGALLVGDIGVSIVAGTGFLRTDIGGAEAISGEFITENPFGAAIPPDLAAPAPVADPGSSPLTSSSGVPGDGSPPAAPDAAPPAADPQPVASIGPLERLCESIHPLRSPGCSEGALAPLGLLGLLATGAVAGLDWRHQQRRAGRAGGASA